MVLTSPGVEVQVVDESFFVPAEPATRPLIIVTSAENKPNSSNTGIARGTLKSNANRPFLVTSQRELADLFGTPLFYKDASQNPIHGGELNEYGLQAAYSFLGVANSAYVLRADADLSQLISQFEAPGANPAAGTYWLDTAITRVGVFEWNGELPTVPNGQKFINKPATFITDATRIDELTGAPKSSVGAIGEYAVVAITNLNKLYYKNQTGTWVLVGSPEWHQSWPAVRAGKSNPVITVGHSMVINGVTVVASGTTIASLASDINAANIRGVTAAVVASRLEIYSDGAVDSPQQDSSLSNAIVIEAGSGNLVTSTVSASAVGIATGVYYGPVMTISPHTSVPRYKVLDPAPRPTGSIWIKTTEVNLGANWRVKLWNSLIEDWENVSAPVYANGQEAVFRLDRAGGGNNIGTGSLYVQYNVSEDTGTDDTPRLATFKIFRREVASPTTFVSKIIDTTTFTADTYTFIMAESRVGQLDLDAFKTIEFTAAAAADDVDAIAGAINSAGFAHIEASVDSRNRLVIVHKTGGEIRLRDGSGSPLILLGYVPFDVTTNAGTTNLYRDPQDPDPDFEDTTWFIASNWKPLNYIASAESPTAIPEDGRLWYSSAVDEVDIMIHNGTTWVGYLDITSPFYASDPDQQTNPTGPIVSASRPRTQVDGTALRNGDLWIDTSDLENYPALYKYDGFNLVWVPVDTSDQTTEDGVIFADARYNTAGANSNEAGSIVDLLTSNFVDFDAPDPALYPRGMMLFNTRRSGFNVKKYVRNYINVNSTNPRFNDESMDGYYPNRWVNESGNDENGAGLFGRKAQRKVVVKQLKAAVDTNQEIRDWERNVFNLIACPGYPELISNMVNLNIDRKQLAFVVGDSPFRLTNDATSLQEWGSNARLAVDNGENGLVTSDEYLGVYYPSGFTTDNFGNDIVVPASHMVLRTIALSDNVSYPWFAPAGTRRGAVNNATAIGYIDAQEGEFRSIALNEGQRDALYSVNINPITFLVGSGICVFGQKTRARNASALDRINVARLVVYLRAQLDKLAKPYIFEPNDKVTRDELKAAAESVLLELVGQRALYDFLVVCDESNNTPSRIDRNELYLDIAIESVRAVEFVYIPLRLKNTGEISGL
jgi:hypothetical protein